jgi:hypothetical protein
MRQWQRWALAGAINLVLAACGGGGDADSPVPPPPSGGGAPQPVLETSRASTAEIGSAGGVLSVTAANGLSYRLEIPPEALPGRVQITMTPVSSIGNLPLSGGLVGAVELQPSGLRFARKAQLRIGAAAPSRPELTLTGFSIESGGPRAARSLAIARGDEVLMLIGHFSTHGAGYGSAADLTSLTHVAGDLTELEEDIGVEIAYILFRANLEPAELVRAAYLGWFDNIVLPLTRRADNDDLLLGAAALYHTWKSFAQLLSGDPTDPVAVAFEASIRPVSSELAARELDWANLAGPKFRAAITANNERCKAQSSLAALRNVLFLQSTAQPLIEESALQAYGIDRNTVLRELCARLIVTAGPTLADPLQSVVPSDLDMTFGLQFDTQPEVQAVPVQVEFNGVNAVFAKASPANGNVQGEFTLGVSAVNGSEPVTLFLEGCLAIDGEVTDVCVDEVVARNGNAASGVGSVDHNAIVEIGLPSGAVNCPATRVEDFGTKTTFEVSVSCAGLSGESAEASLSFTKVFSGSDLVGLTAVGIGNVQKGGELDQPRAFSQYMLRFTATRTTQLAIDGSFTLPMANARGEFYLGRDGVRVFEHFDGSPINQTLTLLPGRYELLILASVSRPVDAAVSVGFNLQLAFGP